MNGQADSTLYTMNDEELKKHFETLEGYIEVLAKSGTDQSLQILAMRAHQQAHLAALRKLLIRQGESPGMLNQRLKSAYQEAVRLYQSQYETFQKNGDVAKLLDHLPLPDNARDN